MPVKADANRVLAKLQERHGAELAASNRELAVTQVALEEKISECESLKQQVAALQMQLAKQPPPVDAELDQPVALSVPPTDEYPMNGDAAHAGSGPAVT
jgi:phage-related minor tail protein